MKNRLLTLSLVRALVIYLSASLLLAACGNKRVKNTSVFTRPTAQIVDAKEANKREIITFSKDNFSMSYVYLVSAIPVNGIGSLLLSNLTQEQRLKADKFKEDANYFTIVLSEAGGKSGRKFSAKFTEIDNTNKGEDQRPSKDITIDLQQAEGEVVDTFLGSNDNYVVELKCLFKDCHAAVVQLVRKSDMAINIFSISIFNAHIGNKKQIVNADEAVKGPNGIMEHPVSILVDKPNWMSSMINTVNIISGQSRLWIGLVSDVLDGLDLNLQGYLLSNEADRVSKQLKVSSSLDSLIVAAETISHNSDDGSLRVRLTMNAPKQKTSNRPEASPAPSPAPSAVNIMPETGYFVEFDIIPDETKAEAFEP